jgi:hypothetical protein
VSDSNGNGQKLEKAAESALLRLAARWMILIGFPAMFAFSVWAGQTIVGGINEFIKEARQEFKDQDDRMNGFDVRLTGVERDVEHLRSR